MYVYSSLSCMIGECRGKETERGMGSEPEIEPSSTPKLPLFSLPIKPSEPPEVLTSPLHTSASVPFLWEESPGKPRAYNTTTTTPKSKPTRCLDLPPRLLAETIKITTMPSPTTVLDGPYVDRSLSHTLSFSFGQVSFNSPREGQFSGKRERKERRNFGSLGWGSFKLEKSGIVGGNFDFSRSFGSQSDSNVKITTRVTRKSSFLSLSHTRSNVLENIYQSFKLAVPWRQRKEKQRNMVS